MQIHRVNFASSKCKARFALYREYQENDTAMFGEASQDKKEQKRQNDLCTNK